MYMAKSAKKPVQTCVFCPPQLGICTLYGYNVYFLVTLFPCYLAAGDCFLLPCYGMDENI